MVIARRPEARPSFRGRALLAGWLGLSAATPLALHALVAHELHQRVEPALTEAAGVPVAIADAEATLDGTLRLSRVRVGAVFAADSVEASVGLSTLLHGAFAADEIRVSRPRLAAHLASDGRSLDLSELVRRVQQRRRVAGPARAAASRLRRVLVTDGELLLTIADHGELRAHDVELSPSEDTLRVVTGEATAHLTAGAFTLDARFARAGLDLSLPDLRPSRAALDGGAVTLLADGQPPLALDHVVLLHDARASRLTAELDHRPLAVRVSRDPLSADASVDGLPLAPFSPLFPRWLHPDGRVSGTVSLRRDEATAHLRLDGVTVEHPLLAAVPVPLTAALDASVSFDPAARAGRGHLRALSGRLAIEADLDVVLDSRVSLSARVPSLPCGEALSGLPAPIRAPLDGLELGGTLGAALDLAFDRAHPDAARLDVAVNARCTVDRDAAAAPVAALDGPDASATLPDGSRRVFGRRDPHFVPLADTPAVLVSAFLNAEDALFFRHHGFDPEDMRKAFVADLTAGRVERGGSTLSQQLVKNLYLTRDRTLARKLGEAVLTWRLEQRISKKRILELYLNLVELGDGVYGIGPGAARWFHTTADRLTPAQAAFLAAITSAPTTCARRIADNGGRLDALTLRRTAGVLREVHASGALSDEAYQAALDSLPALLR